MEYKAEDLRQVEQQLRERQRELEQRVAELAAANAALKADLAKHKQASLEEQHRLSELLREADHRKDQFLAMLGHELRSPLSAIAGAIQVMTFIGSQDVETLQMRQIIERQTDHMSRMINDILEVSRISRGTIQIRPVMLNLVELVRHTVEDARHIFDDAKLSLQLDLPDHPIHVAGDPARLAQVLTNLLQNSAKFTDAGGTVSVGVNIEHDRAVISLRDTGVGIPPETLSRLFEPFSQANRSVERSRGGLGLGLALVKSLVELHGGDVRACSQGLGKGAEFIVHLPLVVPQKAPISVGSADKASAETLRILIIDDQRDSSYPLRRLLEMDGHRVEVAADGVAGIEAANQFKPQVVLCDIGLPGGMNGFDVAQALRMNPGIPSPVLVAVTGYGQDSDRKQSAAAGFDRHLTKPVGQSELRSLLIELTCQRQLKSPVPG